MNWFFFLYCHGRNRLYIHSVYTLIFRFSLWLFPLKNLHSVSNRELFFIFIFLLEGGYYFFLFSCSFSRYLLHLYLTLIFCLCAFVSLYYFLMFFSHHIFCNISRCNLLSFFQQAKISTCHPIAFLFSGCPILLLSLVLALRYSTLSPWSKFHICS